MNLMRLEAAARGLTRYFTGKPCKRGHISERLVINHRCVECQTLQDSAWKKAHRSECTEGSRKWREANREKVRSNKRAYYRASESERVSQAKRAKRWMEENRDSSRAASAKWRKANLPIAAAAASRRKAKLLQRTPAWADHEKIRQFYILAKDLTDFTGVEHEVDHIYPLQGRTVSGFHVETNLQVLTKQANRAKGNRYAGWAS